MTVGAGRGVPVGLVAGVAIEPGVRVARFFGVDGNVGVAAQTSAAGVVQSRKFEVERPMGRVAAKTLGQGIVLLFGRIVAGTAWSDFSVGALVGVDPVAVVAGQVFPVRTAVASDLLNFRCMAFDTVLKHQPRRVLLSGGG